MTIEYELAGRARDGDRDALADLVELLRSRMFAVAYSELGRYHDAQDAVASALLHICLNVEHLREPLSAGAWMCRIVRNEAFKARRRRTNAVELPEDLAASGGDPGSGVVTRVDVQNAIRRLPIDQARALTLFYLTGASIADIAQRTGRPEGTIKRWLHQGRRQIAAELEDYAPMDATINAAILSTDIPADTTEQILMALRDAGFADVRVLPALPDPARDEAGELHLPREIKDARFILIDESVGGRSAFELQAVLKASAESAELYTGVLLHRSPHLQSSVFAAWSAGFDLCLVRESLDISELRTLCIQLLSRIRTGQRE